MSRDLSVLISTGMTVTIWAFGDILLFSLLYELSVLLVQKVIWGSSLAIDNSFSNSRSNIFGFGNLSEIYCTAHIGRHTLNSSLVFLSFFFLSAVLSEISWPIRICHFLAIGTKNLEWFNLRIYWRSYCKIMALHPPWYLYGGMLNPRTPCSYGEVIQRNWPVPPLP